MSLYEVYVTGCAVCGWPETTDHGPYEPSPLDDFLPPLDPRVHRMSCRRCGKNFDVSPARVA